jgi:transcriptional regulator with XRE-family HTH domain
MAARGLTQRHLAMLAGLDHSTISRLLRSERVGLKYVTALRLYRALETERTTPLLGRTLSRDDVVRTTVSRARPRPVGAHRLQ